MSILKSTLKDGIYFFEEPYSVNCNEWLYNHVGCNSIILRNTCTSDVIQVLCYSSDKKYNANLMKYYESICDDSEVAYFIGIDETRIAQNLIPTIRSM